ncbi:MAG: cation:proton antiporter [Candidatus Acidiferrales bacterium]
MNLTLFFGLLGVLLVLAFIANRLALRTGIPDVIVLMGTGLVLGPALHWVDATPLTGVTRGFGDLALILILFEAGLELDLRDTIRHFPGGLVLAVVSYGLSVVGIAYFCIAAMQIERLPAFVAGAVLGCISSSIMLPVLQQIPLRAALKTTLVVESSVSDALAVLAVSVLLDLYGGMGGGSETGWVGRWLLHFHSIAPSHGSILGGVAVSFLLKVLISLVLGIAAGLLWTRLLPLLTEERFWQVLTFGAVLLVYSGAQFAGGSDLFAVIVFGGTLANFPRKGGRLTLSELRAELLAKDLHHQMLTFHSELAFLVRTFFFVLLGVIVNFGGLQRNAVLTLGILGVLLVARFLAVQLSRPVWHGIGSGERELMVWLIPRGLITAVLAFQVVETRSQDFPFLTALAFALILMTNVILLVGSFRARAMAPVVAEATAGSGAPPTEGSQE